MLYSEYYGCLMQNSKGLIENYVWLSIYRNHTVDSFTGIL